MCSVTSWRRNWYCTSWLSSLPAPRISALATHRRYSFGERSERRAYMLYTYVYELPFQIFCSVRSDLGWGVALHTSVSLSSQSLKCGKDYRVMQNKLKWVQTDECVVFCEILNAKVDEREPESGLEHQRLNRIYRAPLFLSFRRLMQCSFQRVKL